MIEAAVVLGFVSFYIVRLVRIFPVISRLTSRGVKPFSCNICMSFWTTAASYLFAVFVMNENVRMLSAAAACGVCLALLDYFKTKAIELPEVHNVESE